MRAIHTALFAILLTAGTALNAQTVSYTLEDPEVSYNASIQTVSFKTQLPESLAKKGGVASCYVFTDTLLGPTASAKLFSFFPGSTAQEVWYSVPEVRPGCYFTRYASRTNDSLHYFSAAKRYCFDALSAISAAATTEQLTLYPNPANNFIEINTNEAVAISIVNNLGATQTKLQLQQGKNTVNISEWNAGVYYVLLNNKVVQRFVK
ncbi:MAG: T9SS type A sorting domain-containing protein [Chitinophagales bacterium]|nr:T9SS type A sorting domain-containing protein [Chitinophagales bacterium]